MQKQKQNPQGGGKKAAKDADIEVLRQMQRTLRFMHDGRSGCYDAFALVEACQALQLQYPVTSQNDASEFYDKLLDTLESALRGSPEQQQMTRCFTGRYTKLKRCHVCQLETVSREETFCRLELEVRDAAGQCCGLAFPTACPPLHVERIWGLGERVCNTMISALFLSPLPLSLSLF